MFGELTARAMTRTTKIGAIVLGGLEVAHLAREISVNILNKYGNFNK